MMFQLWAAIASSAIANPCRGAGFLQAFINLANFIIIIVVGAVTVFTPRHDNISYGDTRLISTYISGGYVSCNIVSDTFSSLRL